MSETKKPKAKIVALHGSFESVPALLGHIAEDLTIEGFCIFTFNTDGRMKAAHLNISRAQMALVGAEWLAQAVAD